MSDLHGVFGIAGNDSPLGTLLRVTATVGDETVGVFFGRIAEGLAPGDLDAPSVTLRADDLLGTTLGDDDPSPLHATSVSGRIHDLLDRAGFPADRRDIAPDGTALMATDTPAARIDLARQACRAAGGTLWADGSGYVRYRDRNFSLMDADTALPIGTAAGVEAVPSSLVLVEDRSHVVNFVHHGTADKALAVTFSDPLSRERFGNRAEVSDDFQNTQLSDLEAVALRELSLGAFPVERVDPVEIIVHNEATAAVALLGIGSLVYLTYTGSDPWSRLQIVGGIAHRVDPDEWSVVLHCFDALTMLAIGATRWSLSRWGVGTWEEAPAAPTDDERGQHA